MIIIPPNIQTDKLTVILDASAFSTSSCLLRLFLTVVEGYTEKIQNNDVEWGSAFHKFRAHYREHGESGIGLAINKATTYYENKPMRIKSNKKYLTKEFLLTACMEYAVKYEKDNIVPVRTSSGEVLLELRFAFPYYIDPLVEILLAGTMDEIGKIKNGIYVVPDCKSSGVWNVEEYFTSYQVSSQLYFYRWALKKYGEMYPDSIFGEIAKDEVGVLIDGVFYKGAVEPIVYRRSNVMLLSQNTLVEFEHLIKDKVMELVSFIYIWLKEKVKPPRFGILNGACKTPYGLCPFAISCASNDNLTQEAILEAQFIKRFYNPMTHGE